MLTEYIGIKQLKGLIADSDELDFTVSAAISVRLQELLYAGSAADSTLKIQIKFKPALEISKRAASKKAVDTLPSITGIIDGELKLVCQRCLEAMLWQPEIRFAYALKLPGSGRNTEVDLFETLEVMEEGLPLKEFIEDELISAMHFSPKHSDVNLCSTLVTVIDNEVSVAEAEEITQPFTGLADLLSKQSSDKNGNPTK